MKGLLLEIQSAPRNTLSEIDESKPLRLRQAASYLGIAEASVYGLVAREKLKPLKPGKHLLFTRESLNAYLNGESETPDPSTFLLKRKKAAK